MAVPVKLLYPRRQFKERRKMAGQVRLLQEYFICYQAIRVGCFRLSGSNAPQATVQLLHGMSSGIGTRLGIPETTEMGLRALRALGE